MICYHKTMNAPTTARAFRSALLLVLALLASTVTASAAAPRWVQVTPFGGQLIDLEQAPSAPATLYAAAANGFFFASADGGATWRRRNGGDTDTRTEDLVVDPFNARIVYARTGGAELLRTVDGGLHWSAIEPFAFTAGIAVDATTPGVLYAGTSDGLYRSIDRGETWSQVALDGLYLSGVALAPHSSLEIFTALRTTSTGPLEVWKSTDGGLHWTSAALPNGFTAGFPRFVFDPVRPGTLYLFFGEAGGSLNPLLRSTDDGASWSELGIEVLDLTAATDGTLFAGTEHGVFRSTDAGTTWVPPLSGTAPPRDSIERVLVSASAPDVLLAAGTIGIWMSSDRGETWETSNRGIRAQGAYSVAVAPTEPSTVITRTDNSFYLSMDRGATWLRAHSWFEGPQPYEIKAVDPDHPQTIYGFGFGVDGLAAVPLKSTDSGRTWIRRRFPYNCINRGSICDVTLTALALDPHRPNVVLVAGTYDYHLGGSGSFLLRSRGGALAHWDELTPLPGTGALAVDPDQRNTYYGLTCRGLFRSQDAGTTWQKTGSGLPGNLCPSGKPKPSELVIDPQDARRIYVGTLDRGVFVSSDRGATFQAMNRGLATAQIDTLVIDPDDPTRLYVGVPSKGVFQWNASRRTWVPLNRGLPLEFFAGDIALDPQDPKALYAAAQNAGLFRLDLDE